MVMESYKEENTCLLKSFVVVDVGAAAFLGVFFKNPPVSGGLQLGSCFVQP